MAPTSVRVRIWSIASAVPNLMDEEFVPSSDSTVALIVPFGVDPISYEIELQNIMMV